MPKKRANGLKNKRLSAKGEFPLIRLIAKRNKYEVDAGYKLGGTKKHRKWFSSLEEAKAYAEQINIRLKNEGLEGFSLTKEQQVDAEKALEILNSKASLTEACRYFMRFNNLNESNKSISSLVDEFLDHKDKQSMLGEKGASERTINDYKHRLGLLSNQFGSLKINEFKEDHFLDWILERGDARGLTRTTKALFSFAVSKDYLPENPLKRKTPIPKIGKPSVLEDNHWRSLVLKALETQDLKNSNRGEPIDMLACVTLGLWCGLRPEAELKRLDWSDVNIEEGFVNIHDDWKVKIGRLVTIPDCAKELLRKCTRQKGTIINPKNFRRRWDWLRETAGVMTAWDSDIMRHTFASMHYGFYGDKQKVINELGHCNDGMLRHYVSHGAKMKKRAKEFFSFKK
jgi:integrase